jgi:hypothetical protein
MVTNDVMFWRKVSDDVIHENLVLQYKITEKEEEIIQLKRELYRLKQDMDRYERYVNKHNKGILVDDELGMVKTKEGFYLR